MLRATLDEVWGETRALLGAARPGAGRARRARPEAPDGARLPLVPRPGEPLGDRRRAGRAAPTTRSGAARRWARSTLGRGIVPRRPGEPHRRPDRPQPARGRGRRHARAAAAHATACPSRRARSSSARGRWPESRLHRACRRSHRSSVIQHVRASLACRPPSPSSASARSFPGASDARGFWRDILAGRDLVTDVPPTHWLIEDYYDPDPGGARQDLRQARRVPVDRRLRPDGVRRPAEHRAGDRHGAAARADRRAAGARGREPGAVRDDGPRAHQRDPRRHLGAGAARLDGEPAAAAGVGQGAARERASPRTRRRRSATASRRATCPGRRRRSPGCSATSSPGASPTASTSAAPTASSTRPAPARSRRCRWAINELAARAVGPRDRRRRRHVQRHLHVHVLQQDAGALADRATAGRSPTAPTARCSARAWRWSRSSGSPTPSATATASTR